MYSIVISCLGAAMLRQYSLAWLRFKIILINSSVLNSNRQEIQTMITSNAEHAELPKSEKLPNSKGKRSEKTVQKT